MAFDAGCPFTLTSTGNGRRQPGFKLVHGRADIDVRIAVTNLHSGAE